MGPAVEQSCLQESWRCCSAGHRLGSGQVEGGEGAGLTMSQRRLPSRPLVTSWSGQCSGSLGKEGARWGRHQAWSWAGQCPWRYRCAHAGEGVQGTPAVRGLQGHPTGPWSRAGSRAGSLSARKTSWARAECSPWSRAEASPRPQWELLQRQRGRGSRWRLVRHLGLDSWTVVVRGSGTGLGVVRGLDSPKEPQPGSSPRQVTAGSVLL